MVIMAEDHAERVYRVAHKERILWSALLANLSLVYSQTSICSDMLEIALERLRRLEFAKGRDMASPSMVSSAFLIYHRRPCSVLAVDQAHILTLPSKSTR